MTVLIVVLLVLVLLGEVLLMAMQMRGAGEDQRREAEQMAELRNIQSLHAQVVKSAPTADEG